jgi:aryl-alcohol dehydrogenase-like predicted oxidoreductase
MNTPQNCSPENLTRREFIHDTALATAGVAAGASALHTAPPLHGAPADPKPLNFNPAMEYRRLGKTGLMISAVCLGGHWKRIETAVPGVLKKQGWMRAELEHPDFKKNRHEVVTRCIEAGMNYIDACTAEEVMAYSEALRGRREKMHLGFSWYQEEMRNANFRTTASLLKTLEKGLQQARLEYVDLWRVTMLEQSGKHTQAEVEELMGALAKAKEQGKARFTGFSSHDRPHIKWMIETFPKQVDAVVTPYTSNSKELPKDSLFEAVRKCDVGLFGIKPFASNSIFKGDSSLSSPNAEEDDARARLAIRYILANPAITAPIPGLINLHQVDNAAKAVRERRELDSRESALLERVNQEAWARLPADYQWLKDWEYV